MTVSTKRRIALFVLVSVLFISVLSANVLVAADRTVLDAEYTIDAAEEAGFDDEFVEEFETAVADEEAWNEETIPVETAVDEILDDVVDDDEVRAEVEAAIDHLYAYLLGDVDTLELVVETEPVKERVLDAVETELEDVSVEDVDDGVFDLAPDELGTDVGASIDEMAESESAFDEEREAFEERIKDEIQAETPRELSDEELDAAYEDQREEINTELRSIQDDAVADLVTDGTIPASFEAPVAEIANAYVDALTREIDHEEYATTVESALGDLRSIALEEIESELDAELPDEVDLAEEFDEDELATIEDAQTVTSTVTLLVTLLPLVAIGIGLLVVALWPASVATIAIGGVSAIVGALAIAGATIAEGQVGSLLAERDGPATVTTFVEVFVGGLFYVLTDQSLLLIAAGIVAIGIGVAIRLDVVPIDLD